MKILKHRGLGLTLILYLILATTYSIVVPIGRGADEWAHYWYAQFIAEHGRLPATFTERETAGYKSDWPPLYHLLAAGLTAGVDTQGPPDFKYRADNIRRQLIPAQGPDAILHTQAEQFPWQQEVLVWHLGRFLSILFSAGALLVTYFITLELFSTHSKNISSQNVGVKQPGMIVSEQTNCAPGCLAPTPSRIIGLNPKNNKMPCQAPYTLVGISGYTVALLAVAILAFNPRFLFTGMLFNYDSLTVLLASLFLWLIIRVAKGYHLKWGFWGLGALAGLAFVTKYLTAFLPLEILALALFNKYQVSGIKYQVKNRDTRHVPRPTSHVLLQAALAFLFITSWWFGYLIFTFNETETYGPVLGTLAPLIRGDGSDRTVEALFAWLSGGQAPPPAYLEKTSYTAWQIISELPTTFWGNPIVRPYPLNWFIAGMSIATILSIIGVALFWRQAKQNRFWLNLLLLHCALPLPFMIIRLFGARDVLEAVQGRHILFLAAPAVAILFALGWIISAQWLANKFRFTVYLWRLFATALIVWLLSGAMGQLFFMATTYPSALPVTTVPYQASKADPVPDFTLSGGAKLIDYTLTELDQSLQVELVWQAGAEFAPEDYQIALRLVDDAGQSVAGWHAYQTQAKYPTRAWEAGDIVRDVGWLPLTNLAAGHHQIELQVIGKDGPLTDWQSLTPYILEQMTGLFNLDVSWTLWQNGQPHQIPPIFNYRETVQFTIHNSQFTIHNFQLIGPDGNTYYPASSQLNWANFIIQPHWPAGDYHWTEMPETKPVLHVATSSRNFEIPPISNPLDVDFAGQVKLLGYHLPERRVQPGEGIPLTLYWQGLQWMGEDFVIFNRLLDNQQVSFGGYDRLPQENYSTLLWAPGEIVTDGFAVPVDPNAPEGVYMINLGLYRAVEGQAQSLRVRHPERGELTEETSITIGPIKVGGPPAGIVIEQIEPQYSVNVSLGEQIALLGYDVELNEGFADFTLYWQAVAQIDTDYTVFAHIRNQNGETVAQKDAPPTSGLYPTSLWDEGEIIKDKISIPVDQLSSGQYQPVVGLYNPVTFERLPVDGSVDGTILLHSFEVSE